MNTFGKSMNYWLHSNVDWAMWPWVTASLVSGISPIKKNREDNGRPTLYNSHEVMVIQT